MNYDTLFSHHLQFFYSLFSHHLWTIAVLLDLFFFLSYSHLPVVLVLGKFAEIGTNQETEWDSGELESQGCRPWRRETSHGLEMGLVLTNLKHTLRKG